MPIDRSAADSFIWSAARLVDRHRYELLLADGAPAPVIEALRGYRNFDGGFGNALEPDLRCPSSQPPPTLYALEILNEADAADGELARAAISSLAARVDTAEVAPAGGIEGEALRPLDLSPRPGSRSRGLISDVEVQRHLDLVESEQQDDGGWIFDWRAWSPAQTTEWRGNVTIRALVWLADNGRL